MAFYDNYGWKPYVTGAMRGARTAQALLALRKRGVALSPVVVEGRAIARTFWGRAWCDNLERYSDFANRLPRGRTYVRSGAVVDLQVAPGAITARVSGSHLYHVDIKVAPVPAPRWSAICRDCAGEIDSMVALLQGRLPERVMTRLYDERAGLFPSPREIAVTCSCPDWASMCKHVAAALYGVGARLDRQPELLFALREVDQEDLVAKAGSSLGRGAKKPAAGRILDASNLSELFEIEISQATPAARPARGAAAQRKGSAARARRTTRPRRRGESG